MIRRPPRSTLDRSSAASDVYKRQGDNAGGVPTYGRLVVGLGDKGMAGQAVLFAALIAVSYTHLRAHETVLDIVCRLLLEKTKLTRTLTVIQMLK